LKCDGTCGKTRFQLSGKWASPLKPPGGGGQFSRLLAAEMCASAVVMLDTPCSEVVWRVLATQCIRQFIPHFPSCASPCAITFQLESNYKRLTYGLTLESAYFVLGTLWSMSWCFVMLCYHLLLFNQMARPTGHTLYKYKQYFRYIIQHALDYCIMTPWWWSISWNIFVTLYYDQQMHNYFTNYHTPTCFDTIVSSSGSL